MTPVVGVQVGLAPPPYPVDSSTGYPLTEHVGVGPPPDRHLGIVLGTTAFPKGWGDGLPSGEYVFSMYAKANWTGEVILGRVQMPFIAAESKTLAARSFVKSDHYQLIWFTFYHDGKGENFTLGISNIPEGGTFSIGLFAIHRGTTPARYTFPIEPQSTPIGNATVEDYVRGIYYGDSSPTTGTYNQGDIVYNRNPTAGGHVGWICVSSGSPGLWKLFGPISP
jgi:hypothetical protein